MTITNKENLKQIFDKVNKVYYFEDANKSRCSSRRQVRLRLLQLP